MDLKSFVNILRSNAILAILEFQLLGQFLEHEWTFRH
jgi:hypothetical protein